MTIGARIQDLRKAAGLSQEALGDLLGVSRQSISKWESDLAVPELDKLIALSKRFNLSIGALLGVEDEAAAQTELTDRELEALSAIAAKLAPPSPPQPTRRLSRILLVGAALLATVAVAIAGERLTARMSGLESQVTQLHSSMAALNAGVSQRIDSVTGQVAGLLEEQARTTTDQHTEIAAVDLHANTVTFALRATPKTLQEGAAVTFRADWPGGSATLPGEGAGTYTGTVTCPLTDEIRLYLELQEGPEKRSQLLEVWTGLDAKYALRLEGYDGGDVRTTPDGAKLVEGRLPADRWLGASAMGWLEWAPGMDPQPEFVRVVAALFVNGELMAEHDRGADHVNRDETGVNFSRGWYWKEQDVTFSPGDRVVTAVLAEDNYGRRASALSQSYRITEDGTWEWAALPQNDGTWGLAAWPAAE